MATVKGEGIGINAYAARLFCIEQAIDQEMEVKADWADWLKEGVKAIKDGEEVTEEWLREFDQKNSYI